jgi:hypothetical protein
MKGIQAGEADALSQLYDRYNGILKALIPASHSQRG